jgi:hypothetical protein
MIGISLGTHELLHIFSLKAFKLVMVKSGFLLTSNSDNSLRRRDYTSWFGSLSNLSI